jgi:hypothetical protein
VLFDWATIGRLHASPGTLEARFHKFTPEIICGRYFRNGRNADQETRQGFVRFVLIAAAG